MTEVAPAPVVIEPGAFGALIERLHAAGRTVVGPTERDGAVVLDEISTLADLPIGRTDDQAPGRYRLGSAPLPTLFGYAVGPTSLRRFLTPPEHPVWRATRVEGSVRFEAASPEVPSYAFIGVRACDLAALVARSSVPEPWAHETLAAAVVIAVQCASSAATCFCASAGTGPEVRAGADLVVTELTDPEHVLVLDPRTAAGRELVTGLPSRPATTTDRQGVEDAVARASVQERSLDLAAARASLGDALRHPQWDAIAERCLSCTNCTMVCPTCFCTTSAVEAPLNSDVATTVQRWDSCFTVDFSHLHGAGSVRPDTRSQYRQWLTHKLVTWWDQFGTSGCVGCGRCITWCPVGIDLTAEVPEFSEPRS